MGNKICMICEEGVSEEQWFINAGVLGEFINIQGHRKCVENVDNLVVIPARIMANEVIHVLISRLN